jgi:hypothetical protein
MPVSNNALCLECGELVARLSERTGWCITCTNAYYLNSNNCPKCGRFKSLEEKSCDHCKVEEFFSANADHIEHYMIQGNSLAKSLDLMRNEVRPSCASCGEVLIRAARNTVFCRRTDRCRKAVRRYRYLTHEKRIDKPQALTQVLHEINGSD